MRFSKTSARYALEYAAFRVAAAFFGLLPLDAASAVAGKIFRVIGRFSHKRNARAMANLAAAFPEWPQERVRATAADMWENLGRVFGESFRLDRLARGDRFTFGTPETLDVIRSEIAAGRGSIICSSHSGNWEVGAMAVGHALPKLNVAGIYRHINNPHVDAYVAAMRKRFYPGGLFVKSPSAPRYLMRHAKTGGALAILADLREFRGPSAMFFGRPAPCSPFPAVAALSLGAKLYYGHVTRRGGARFLIDIVEIPVVKSDDRDADVQAVTQALQSEIEKRVRENPEQWLWSHRRWG